jgi:predicted GIY-YIG superfamily endonuclease
MAHKLYRHFDETSQLLYVGVSLSVAQRLAQHRDHAHWFERITRVEMQSFDTRDQALAAERMAIQTENPLFNIQYSTLPKAEKIEKPHKPNLAAWLTRIRELMSLERQEIATAFWQWREERRSK